MDRYKRLSDYKPLGPAVRVGADIDGWCTKCKQLMSHTVMVMDGGAPLRVICNTCKSQHKYRAEQTKPKPVSSRSPRSKAARSKAVPRPARAWQQASQNKDLRNPHPYSPKETFLADQVLIHGKFGIGVVIEVRPGGKISVVFEDDTRTLVHARN